MGRIWLGISLMFFAFFRKYLNRKIIFLFLYFFLVLTIITIAIIVKTQFFDIKINSQQLINALKKTDYLIINYYRQKGNYPSKIEDLLYAGYKIPLLPKGYKIREGFNLTANEIIYINKITNFSTAHKAAVMINFQAYDIDHLTKIIE